MPPPGASRANDWLGVDVVTLVQLTTERGDEVPAGSYGFVVNVTTSRKGGLYVRLLDERIVPRIASDDVALVVTADPSNPRKEI